ncbi:MAG: hypothetical protein JRE28_13230 [Deltaproteobacteria bacterium]|nr:hypothetical protein [Deltaproteobacteria bacterium]
MKRWIKKFESVFVSVTFAEMGEYNNARNMLGIKPVNFKKLWDDVFISVTFAEAG